MMLEGSNTSAAIRWVREDLDASLDSVRANLEAFAEDPSKREPLCAIATERCATSLDSRERLAMPSNDRAILLIVSVASRTCSA